MSPELTPQRPMRQSVEAWRFRDFIGVVRGKFCTEIPSKRGRLSCRGSRGGSECSDEEFGLRLARERELHHDAA